MLWRVVTLTGVASLVVFGVFGRDFVPSRLSLCVFGCCWVCFSLTSMACLHGGQIKATTIKKHKSGEVAKIEEKLFHIEKELVYPWMGIAGWFMWPVRRGAMAFPTVVSFAFVLGKVAFGDLEWVV